jgi:hypothetical protein
MAQHHVEQAIFASEKNQSMRGYQLVARSAGVNGAIAREITAWSPSHGSILGSANHAHGLSFFRTSSSKFVIGRTVYGLPEYSGRGGLQSWTRYLVISREHLTGFDNNICKFLTVARSQGLLHWTPRYPSVLPSLDMVSHWALADSPRCEMEYPQTVAAVRESLAIGRRVAIVEADKPVSLLREIFASVQPEMRLELSFGLGLRPSIQRPFLLQLFGKIDRNIRAALSSEQVTVISATPSCRGA